MHYDKYDPISGGTRAALAADYDTDQILGVGLDANGLVVPGAGATGIIGVLWVPKDKVAGDVVDVMTAGEVVEFGGNSGSSYTANTTTGVIDTTAASGTQIAVGFTVEDDRLVVRI